MKHFEKHESGSYRLPSEDRMVAMEQRRLEALARLRDPRSMSVIDGVGIARGWRCLEVGAGAGTLSRWLASRVGATGEVLSTDIDLRFHLPAEGAMEVRKHDLMNDPLSEGHYDLVHARAVLQHIPDREEALDRLRAAARPGGWVVVEDSDWSPVEHSELPEPMGTVTRLMTLGTATQRQWDPYFGRRLLREFETRGFVEMGLDGRVWAMSGGRDNCEWWVLAVEHSGPRFVEAGLLTPEQLEGAIAQAREPGFRMISPLSVAVWGRVPTE
ncbi:methyltransferase domain-containing protein [Myxococcota bacterium]|nr:methyltransferase domain-containing protein [Myxococcota bacterium]